MDVVTRFQPSSTLTNRIASIDVVEAERDELIVLPSTSAVLGFQFSGRVRLGDTVLSPSGITGIQSVPRTYSYERGTVSVLVRFTPDGAACLGVPVAELASRSIALDDLLPRERVAEVHERLSLAQDSAARVRTIEEFLVALPDARDRLVKRALELLDRKGSVSVSRVASALGMSERQLERRFLMRVGVTPKRFATLRRFERVISQAKTAPSLFLAALDAGYYDQSHFIREFRRFAGVSPRQFFARSDGSI